MLSTRVTRLRGLMGLALLAGAAGLGACASAHPVTTPPAPTAARLSDVDIRDIATAIRLEDSRANEAATLARLAHSATPEVRRRAYLAAGRIGDRAARPLLRAGVRDPVPDVRAAAAFGLGLLRDTAMAPILASVALRDAAPVAAAALFALARIRTDAARTGVQAVLDFGTGSQPAALPGPSNAAPAPDPQPTEVLGRALLSIWRFPRDTAAVRVVRTYAQSPDTALRWRAAYALMRFGEPGSAPDLLRLIADTYAGVRAQGARGLRATVADSAGQRAAAQQALVLALADGSPHVRIEAATALGGYRAPELAAPLTALLADSDGNVAIAAARALGALGRESAASALDARTDHGPGAVRAAALQALVRVAPAIGLPRAAHYAASTSWRDRWYAADALGAGRWATAAPLLDTLVRDRDPRVATAALGSVQQLLGDSIPPPRALVIEQLAAPDPFVRAAAIAVLAARPDPGNLQAFLDSYARASADSADDAAVAAVEALGGLQHAGVPAAHDFFARFHRWSDPVVRLHVASTLGQDWGPVFPLETGRAASFYEDLVRRLVAPVLAGGPAPRVRILTRHGDTGSAQGPPGEVVLELAAADEPLTVDNFLSLAHRRYFHGDRWHRVVPDFVVQDGDPRGDGNGGPGYAIRDELSLASYLRGTLGMALSGPDTGGSQFFIALSPQPHLDGNYTVFGHVVSGWEVLDRVLQDDLIQAVQAAP